MKTLFSFDIDFRKAWVPVLIFLIMGYMVYHMIEGDRGWLAYLRLNREIARLSLQLDELRSREQVLQRRVGLLRPDNLDPDLLEERARDVLGLMKRNEIVIFLPDNPSYAQE